jgi:hypothetical protein
MIFQVQTLNQNYHILNKPAKGCDEYGDFENEVIRIDT